MVKSIQIFSRGAIMVPDFQHVIIGKHGPNKAFTDSRGSAAIRIPLKPENENSYKDCIEKGGGHVNLGVVFKKKQENELKQEDFVSFIDGSTYYGISQKEIDARIDNALQIVGNAPYSWINTDENAKRELVGIDGDPFFGYFITNGNGREVFWSTNNYCRLGIRENTFMDWRNVRSRLEFPIMSSPGCSG
jgi:hypothetical protein